MKQGEKDMAMLLPTASELRRALIRHDETRGDDERRSTPETARAREDSAYTLCVLTGTHGVAEARRAAHALLHPRPVRVADLTPVPGGVRTAPAA